MDFNTPLTSMDRSSREKIFSLTLRFYSIEAFSGLDEAHVHCPTGASLIAQLVKNLPAVQETPVRFLGREDPLEKGKATHPVGWPREFHRLYV